MSKPSRLATTNPALAPGAKVGQSFDPGFRSSTNSLLDYDDFVAVHINNTLTIHGTVREFLQHELPATNRK